MSNWLVKQTASVVTMEPCSLIKKLRTLSTSLVSVQDREKSGGRLVLAPSLELPDNSSSGPMSASIEGPKSIPKPVVDAFVLPMN